MAKKEYNYQYESGKLVRATESDVEFTGEIVTAKVVVNTIRYYYDSEDQMTKKVIVPATGTEQTIYHETADDNSVVKFFAGGKTVTSHSKTDSFGRKVFDELQLGTGFVSRQFQYHAGEVTDQHKDNAKLKSSATTQLVSQIVLSDGRAISYEYDKEERITKVDDSVDGITTYTYDALGQLLTETVNGVVVNSMKYDNYGNIVEKNGKAYTYGDAKWKDLLTGFDGKTIEYDAQGNPTSYLGHTLAWEKGRQLKSFTKEDGTVISYTYNANGIRTSKTVAGVKHEFMLDGTKILRETWGGNTLIPLYDNEDSVCGILYNNMPYYFLKNLQGDVIAIVDKNAQTVARYTYDAWGKLLSVKDANGNDIDANDHIAIINPFRYRCYYYDTEIGLYYLQSRYYDAGVGRFLNADESENVELISKKVIHNLYTYCEQDPVNYTDKTGQAIWAAIGKAFLGALNQYVSDIVTNILAQVKGWKVFKPCSSVWKYIASALSAIVKGGKIFKSIAKALINSVANAIEKFMKKEKTPLWRRIITFIKDVALGMVSEFITEVIFSKVMSLTPRNYSRFANSQYMKNANITPSQIRQKMQKLVKAGMKTANVFSFFADALIGAC